MYNTVYLALSIHACTNGVYASQQNIHSKFLWMSQQNEWQHSSDLFTSSCCITCVHSLFRLVLRARLRLLAFFDTSSNTDIEQLNALKYKIQSKYCFHFFSWCRFPSTVHRANKQADSTLLFTHDAPVSSFLSSTIRNARKIERERKR